MAHIFKALALAVLLLVGSRPSFGAPAGAPVVVSSKLSSESAMIGQMIRLLLEAHGIPTVDRMTLGRDAGGAQGADGR